MHINKSLVPDPSIVMTWLFEVVHSKKLELIFNNISVIFFAVFWDFG
jgi:hypothetical protein